MAITGVLMFNALAYLSLGYTMRSTNAALINRTTPSLTMVTAVAIGLDRLASLRLIGALASLTGAVWILYRGSLEALFNLSFYRGDLIVLVATLMWAIYIILVDRITHTLSPLSLLRLLPPRSPCPF
jgi:drug/metabolite transporter (DMT)-like permease